MKDLTDLPLSVSFTCENETDKSFASYLGNVSRSVCDLNAAVRELQDQRIDDKAVVRDLQGWMSILETVPQQMEDLKEEMKDVNTYVMGDTHGLDAKNAYVRGNPEKRYTRRELINLALQANEEISGIVTMSIFIDWLESQEK